MKWYITAKTSLINKIQILTDMNLHTKFRYASFYSQKTALNFNYTFF